MTGIAKHIISANTKNELKELSDQYFTAYTADADNMRLKIAKLRNTVNALEEGEELTNKENIPTDLKELKQLLRLQEFILLTQLIWLDIVCAFRVYYNAKFEYEGIFSSKLLIITVNEGSKKLFHFYNHRNKSFWGKDIKNFVLDYCPSKLTTYEEINSKIQALELLYKNFDWEIKRKLLVHYDDTPSKVYDLLNELDIELISKISTPFLHVLQKMKILAYDLNLSFFLRKNNIWERKK